MKFPQAMEMLASFACSVAFACLAGRSFIAGGVKLRGVKPTASPLATLGSARRLQIVALEALWMRDVWMRGCDLQDGATWLDVKHPSPQPPVWVPLRMQQPVAQKSPLPAHRQENLPVQPPRQPGHTIRHLGVAAHATTVPCVSSAVRLAHPRPPAQGAAGFSPGRCGALLRWTGALRAPFFSAMASACARDETTCSADGRCKPWKKPPGPPFLSKAGKPDRLRAGG